MIELPDVPRWVEAHGIAADPEHWRTPLGDGFALGHDAARLIVIAGDADVHGLAALARSYPTHTLLLEDPQLIDRPAERAILHTLPDPDALPDPEGAMLVDDATPLPSPLADELTWAKSRGPVLTVYLDGQPAAFAYAPWRSAKLFDVSVDTVIGARQLGLGTIVAAAMIRHEMAQGRAPVWGADEGNAASLRLAQRLGFVAVDEIWVAACVR
ncbi:MAG TPA: GNAT family N-acetyltransferase [Kofleriaceae bacterium]